MFQFLTHSTQHEHYIKDLNDRDAFSLSYVLAHSGQTPVDTKGKLRQQKAVLKHHLETRLRCELSLAPWHMWPRIVEQHLLLWSLQQTLASRKEQNLPTSDSHTATGHNSAPTVPGYVEMANVGTGIDHFPPCHRLQKRRQRAIQLQQTFLECAPSLRQHLTNFSLSPPVFLLPYENASALPFPLHSFPFCSLRLCSLWGLDAPLLRQHFPQTFATPIPVFDSRTHSVGISCLGNLFGVPLSGIPYNNSHSLLVHSHLNHHFSQCAPNLKQHLHFCSANSPDPEIDNALLFELHDFQSSLYVRMGIFANTYFGISSHDLFPHAQTAVPHTSHKGSFNVESMSQQHFDKRPSKEQEPKAIKLGHFHQECSQGPEQFTYWPLGAPHAIVLFSRHGIQLPCGYWRRESPPDCSSLRLRHGYVATFPSSTLWAQGLHALRDTTLGNDFECTPMNWTNSTFNSYDAFGCFHIGRIISNTAHTFTERMLEEYEASFNANTAHETLSFYGNNSPLSGPSSSSDESFANRPHCVQTRVSPFSQFDQQQQCSLPNNSPSCKILTYEGYSSFQMSVLFRSLSVPDALVSEYLLDWVLELLTTSTRYGVFYFDNHWFPYYFHNQCLTLVLPHKFYLSGQPLLHYALTQLQHNVLQHIVFLQSPPTPSGLCGLTAAFIVHHWVDQHHATTMYLGDRGFFPDAWHLLRLSTDSGTFSWTHLSALHHLHSIHLRFCRYTKKLPYLAPIGHMEATSSSSNNDEPPHPFDFRTIQVDNHQLFAHPLVDLPLSSPDLPQTPITISLYPTANDLAQQNDIESYLQQFFIYCHIAQTLQFQLFTVTPEQSFLNEWLKTFPGYDRHTIDVILVWNSLHSTWLRTDFAEIEDLTRKQKAGACHLRIVFHSRYIHVTFPLMKRIFSIEILPTFT